MRAYLYYNGRQKKPAYYRPLVDRPKTINPEVQAAAEKESEARLQALQERCKKTFQI